MNSTIVRAAVAAVVLALGSASSAQETPLFDELYREIAQAAPDVDRLNAIKARIDTLDDDELTAGQQFRLAYHMAALLPAPLAPSQLAFAEQIVAPPFPAVADDACAIAQDWATAVNHLCETYVSVRQHDKVLPLINSFSGRDRPFCVRCAHARVLLDWEDNLIDKREAREHARSLVLQLVLQIPQTATAGDVGALHGFLSGVKLNYGLRLEAYSMAIEAAERAAPAATTWEEAFALCRAQARLLSSFAAHLQEQALLADRRDELQDRLSRMTARAASLAEDDQQRACRLEVLRRQEEGLAAAIERFLSGRRFSGR